MKQEELVHGRYRNRSSNADELYFSRTKSLIDSCEEKDSESDDEEESDASKENDDEGKEPFQEDQPRNRRGRSFGVRLGTFYSEWEQAAEVAMRSISSSSRCGEKLEGGIKRHQECLVGNKECFQDQKNVPIPTSKLGPGKSERRSLVIDFRECRYYWQDTNVNVTVTTAGSTESWKENKEHANVNSFSKKAKEDFKNNYNCDNDSKGETTSISSQGSEAAGLSTLAAFGACSERSSDKIFEAMPERPVVLGKARDIGEGFLLRTGSSPETGATQGVVKVASTSRFRSFDLGKIVLAMNKHDREEKAALLDGPALANKLSSIEEENETDIAEEAGGGTGTVHKYTVWEERGRKVDGVRGNHGKQAFEKTMFPRRSSFRVTKKGLKRGDELDLKNQHKTVTGTQEKESAKSNQLDVVRRVRRQFKKMHRARQEGRSKNQEHVSFPDLSKSSFTGKQERPSMIRSSGNSAIRAHESQNQGINEEECIIFAADIPETTDVPRQIMFNANGLANITPDQHSVEVATSLDAMNDELPKDEGISSIDRANCNGAHQKQTKAALYKPARPTVADVENDSWNDLNATMPILQEHIDVLGYKESIGMSNKERAVFRTEKGGTRRRINMKPLEEFDELSTKVGHKGWKKKFRQQTSKFFRHKQNINRKSIESSDRDTPAHWPYKGLQKATTEETLESSSIDVPHSKSSVSFSFPDSSLQTGELENRRTQHSAHGTSGIPLEEC